jgi:exodeoxyribonuclease-3
MKIVSFNVNSLRIRLDIINSLIESYNPDIICFQETKISQENDMPFDFFKKLGYIFFEYELSSNKGHSGVLIVSKIEIYNKISINFLENNFQNIGSERHISIDFKINNNSNEYKIINLHNFYVPSGGSGEEENNLNSDKFYEKLRFLENMIKFFQTDQKEKYKIILGDINIAPFENDVFNHKMLLNVISHTKFETDAFQRLLLECDLIDSARIFFDNNKKIFTWFSYRSKNWKLSYRGRRLDHILISNNLKKFVKNFQILEEFREMIKPSDHCPILIEL